MTRLAAALGLLAVLLVAGEVWLGGHGVPGGFLLGGAAGSILLVAGAKLVGAALQRPDRQPADSPPGAR